MKTYTAIIPLSFFGRNLRQLPKSLSTDLNGFPFYKKIKPEKNQVYVRLKAKFESAVRGISFSCRTFRYECHNAAIMLHFSNYPKYTLFIVGGHGTHILEHNQVLNLSSTVRKEALQWVITSQASFVKHARFTIGGLCLLILKQVNGVPNVSQSLCISCVRVCVCVCAWRGVMRFQP